MLLSLKLLSRIFYRPDFGWIGPTPKDPWDVRLVVFLNHTSLFEPVFLSGVPTRFIWRLAAHGVIPAADKTTGRPLGSSSWVADLEAATGRVLSPRKRGPKPGVK